MQVQQPSHVCVPKHLLQIVIWCTVSSLCMCLGRPQSLTRKHVVMVMVMMTLCMLSHAADWKLPHLICKTPDMVSLANQVVPEHQLHSLCWICCTAAQTRTKAESNFHHNANKAFMYTKSSQCMQENTFLCCISSASVLQAYQGTAYCGL